MSTQDVKEPVSELAGSAGSIGKAGKWGRLVAMSSLALATWALAACGPFGPAQAPGTQSTAVTAAVAATATAIIPDATPAATALPPAPVTSAGLRSASYEGTSFKYPADLAQDVQGELVAADEGAGEVPWTKPVPSHVEISLTGYALAKTAVEARVIVYPAPEFAAGNPEAAGRIASLQQLLDRGSLEPGEQLPFLPLVNALGLMQSDVKFLPFEGGHGVRYLTQLNQGPTPINNRELFYTFQGLTDDGKHYVVALLPVSHGALPADSSSLAPAELEALAADYKQYLATTAQTLNAQDDATFTPALGGLDTLVGSIAVGKPTGQSLSGAVQWGGKPVSGVRVELRQPGWRSNPGPSNVAATTLSDAAGQYVFQNPPAGDWSLCAVWPDGEESQAPTPAVQIAAGQVVPAGPDTTLKLARTLKLVEPAFGAQVDTLPTLRWEDFPGATGYRVFASNIGTGELTLDQVVTATAFKFTSPLLPGSKYQLSISALDNTQSELAIVQGEFWTSGAAPVPTPNPADAGAENLPPDCQPHAVPGSALYADPAGRFCFVYPARFKVETSGFGQQDVELGVVGPALDKSPEPLQASMLIAVTPVVPGTDLKTAVDAFLKQFEGMPVPAIERKEFAMGGAPAELLEVVPGRTGSRDIFALGGSGDKLYHFIFMPSVRDFPQAQADFEELWNTLTGHFAFLLS